MSDQLAQMVMHYLTDMAERGDDEAKILLGLILNEVSEND